MYVKLIDGVPNEPPINKGSIINYNTNIDLLIQDGYKVLIPAEIPVTNRMYHFEYTENSDNIAEFIVYDETQEEADARDLANAKQQKISENDIARDAALIQGVEYRDVLFDSDTDQKVNLLATVSVMDDETTIMWFGMDNQPLECTKEDLTNIGGLIIQLHTFCWTKNAQIKGLIAAAQTVADIQAIEIDYTLPLEIESEETNEN